MAKAIAAGVPKQRIEEAAAKTQARIDTGSQVVVGVNKYRPDNDVAPNVLKVDNAAVRAAQLDKLARLREERDETQTQAALSALTEGQNQTVICWILLCAQRAQKQAWVRFLMH